MPQEDGPSALPEVSREELIAMVTRAHHDAAYQESTAAGNALAAQSKLPGKVAHNLGAGFGQWTFFPEAAEIVEFACAYVPPSSEEEVWALARTWASDDAASRHSLMALVGREILQAELRRIEVPALRELFDEVRPSRVLALRRSLGLAAPEGRSARALPDVDAAAPHVTAAGSAAADTPAARVKAPKPPPREIPTRMPKPTLVRPPKREPPPPPLQFEHPKFGVGALERRDGEGPDAKLTIKFATGTKTLLAHFVKEVPAT